MSPSQVPGACWTADTARALSRSLPGGNWPRAPENSPGQSGLHDRWSRSCRMWPVLLSRKSCGVVRIDRASAGRGSRRRCHATVVAAGITCPHAQRPHRGRSRRLGRTPLAGGFGHVSARWRRALVSRLARMARRRLPSRYWQPRREGGASAARSKSEHRGVRTFPAVPRSRGPLQRPAPHRGSRGYSAANRVSLSRPRGRSGICRASRRRPPHPPRTG